MPFYVLSVKKKRKKGKLGLGNKVSLLSRYYNRRQRKIDPGYF